MNSTPNCLRMAATMTNPEHKKQLQEMAEAWMMLAAERRKRPADKGDE
jgi:hypothetical protein